MAASRRTAPEKSEDQKNHETVSILKAKVRRLERLLKDAKKNECSCSPSYEATDEALPIPPTLPPSKQYGLSCNCSAEVREVDLYSHFLYICSKCKDHKSVPKRSIP